MYFNNFLDFFFNKNKFIKNLKRGSIVISKILQIDNKNVILSSNLKSESYLPLKEFLNYKNKIEIKKGEYVKVLLLKIDDGFGKTIVSRDLFKKFYYWRLLKYMLINKIKIKCNFINKVKGGFSLNFKGIRCFLPFSNLEKKVSSNFNFYENKILNYRLISLNFNKKNVILSRKLFVFKLLNKNRRNFLNSLKVGKLIKGIIKNITNYGIYVDLGYFDGLIFYKNVNWIKLDYPNEKFFINQSILTKILKVDKKNRIFLGLKQIKKNNFKKFIFNYKIGFKKIIRVKKITNNSIIIVIQDGIFGFIKKIFLNKKRFYKKFLSKIKVNCLIEIIIKKKKIKKKIIIFKIKKFLNFLNHP